MHTEGADKCSRALDTVVHLSEAQKLFDEAQVRPWSPYHSTWVL